MFKPNEYTAYQSPLLTRTSSQAPTLSRFRASPRTSLKSFWLFRSSSLDSADVSLAQEDYRPRVPDQAEESRLSIRLFSRNKYLKLSLCLVYQIYPSGRLSRSDLTIGYLEVDSNELSNNRLSSSKGLRLHLQAELLHRRGDPVAASLIGYDRCGQRCNELRSTIHDLRSSTTSGPSATPHLRGEPIKRRSYHATSQ